MGRPEPARCGNANGDDHLVFGNGGPATGKVADLINEAYGSFEKWALVVGNALRHAGVDGFLANRDETVDAERDTLESVLSLLKSKFGDRDFTAAEAAQVAGIEVGDFQGPREFGTYLGTVKDRRVYLGDRVAWLERAPQAATSRKSARWRVRSEGRAA